MTFCGGQRGLVVSWCVHHNSLDRKKRCVVARIDCLLFGMKNFGGRKSTGLKRSARITDDRYLEERCVEYRCLVNRFTVCQRIRMLLESHYKAMRTSRCLMVTMEKQTQTF